MTYVSTAFLVFVALLLMLYYILPTKWRWLVLLIGSIAFYWQVSGKAICIVFGTIIWSYLAARLINRYPSKILFVIANIGVVVPWIVIKHGDFLVISIFQTEELNMIVPLGISFYTLQIVSYIVDVYKKKIEAQESLLKYVLYVLFFPQIVQGPIPRYHKLADQLYTGHSFDEKRFVMGFHLILWGFFLKLVLADKAAIIVNTVFENYNTYGGFYIWVAGILYSIELYADFLACVTISQGVAGLFGIELEDNFNHPYLAESIKEFWRRWHLSLSEWLKDYIYIPLGGSRKGRMRKYINLIITFMISGVWHGAGYKFLLWGMIHGGYQIVGDLTNRSKKKIYKLVHLEATDTQKMLKKMGTFFGVMLAWIVFRAESLRDAINMIISMFSVWNPWICFDNSLFGLGLSVKESMVLIVAILILIVVDILQEKGVCIRNVFLNKNIVLRFITYIIVIIFIMTFGTYGFGYNVQDFIYGVF